MSAVEELILVVPVSASSLMEALYNGRAGGRAVRLRGGSLVCQWFSETRTRSAVLLAMLYCGSRRCRQGLPMPVLSVKVFILKDPYHVRPKR